VAIAFTHVSPAAIETFRNQRPDVKVDYQHLDPSHFAGISPALTDREQKTRSRRGAESGALSRHEVDSRSSRV
jgi:hypothetical protein